MLLPAARLCHTQSRSLPGYGTTLPTASTDSSLGDLSLSFQVRRWCLYEWFYSALDYPWFARNEFLEYLEHAGLGGIKRLSRTEWGVIRSSLGHPRRLSRYPPLACTSPPTTSRAATLGGHFFYWPPLPGVPWTAISMGDKAWGREARQV